MSRKSTKRALLLSALSLLLCVSMLIGSTYAWFTDEVTSAGNIIKSGKLDVTMEWYEGTEAVPAVDSTDWIDASAGAIFDYKLWEPGYTAVRHIKIANEGTLALKYQLNIVAEEEVSELADVIDVYYIDPAAQIAERTDLTADMKLGTLTEVLANVPTTASGNLLAGENDTITIALKMQETAGNKYQDLSIGSSFAVELLATQLTHETDSFDEQYDAEAVYPVANIGDLKEALAESKDGDIIQFTNDIKGDIALPQKPDTKVVIDGNGQTFEGTLLVNGKSATYTTAGVTIKNVNFTGATADACIQLGNGDTNTRYTCNVTIEDCTFDAPGAVGVKSYTGGDKNVVIRDCTATANAHSLAQLKGVDGVLIENCEVYSKNGINLNNSDNVTISGCTVDVKGYAVRFGETSGGVGAAETYLIKNSTLKSECDDGDAVIVLRGTADYATLTIENTTLTGTIEITNTATGATVVK